MTNQIHKHQNLIDVAIQHSGEATAAIGMGAMNNLSITDDLQPGSEIDTGEILNADVVKKLARYGNVPATAYTYNLLLSDGVGYWEIETDFTIQ